MSSIPSPPDGAPRAGLYARIASALTAIVCVAGAFAQRNDAVLPPEVTERVFREYLRVDGEPVLHADHLDVLIRGRGPDQPVTISGNPAVVVRTVRDVSDPVVALTLVSALAYLAVAVAVLAPRRSRAGIRDLHAAFLAAAVLIAVGGVTRPTSAIGKVLAYSYVVAFGVCPAAFFRSTLSFPGRPGGFARQLGAVVGLVALALVIWAAIAWGPFLESPTGSNHSAIMLPWGMLTLLFVVGIFGGLARIAWSSLRPTSAIEGRQARWILAGVAIGAAPYTLLRLVPRLLGGHDVPISPAVDRAFEIAVPIAFAAAVARDRLLGIDLIRRRRLVHASVALVLAAALFGALLGLADAFGPTSGDGGRWSLALALVIPTALFGALRRTIAPLIDQHVFGIDAGRDQALAELPDLVAAADTPDQLTCAIARVVTSSLHASSVTFESAKGPASDGSPAADPNRIVHRLRSSQSGGGGTIVVGPKTDGRAYVDDELAFVEHVADVAATALDRIRLRNRLAREEAARLAADDLTRRKTDFFARLAHDLRSPLASIRWSASNVKDGLAGPIAPGQVEYLRSIEAAAVQLSRLVDDLVDLGRSDLEVGRRQRVNLSDVVREGGSILKPVAESRDVRIDVHIADGIAPVRGRHDAALRVVVNLLDNAIKYSPAGATVDVTVEPTADGGVLLAVRDRGPGLPPCDRERLFRLFEQGPESPHTGAKGFGIGLHVVKSWTEAMAGSVEVDDAPGGGARFTCRFPKAAAEERAP